MYIMTARITKLLLLFSGLILSFSLAAQYPNQPVKSRLGWQTTGSGLIFVGSGNPNFIPTNIKNAYAYVDSVKNTMYIYQDSLWQQVSPYPSSTPPLLKEAIGNYYLSSGSGTVWGDGISEIWDFGESSFVYRRGAIWYNTNDSICYIYNISLNAWQPLDPIYNNAASYISSGDGGVWGDGVSESWAFGADPADVDATDSTAAVTYKHNLYRNESNDTLYRYSYALSDWIPIAELTTANNGLSMNGDTVQLGGILTKETTISSDDFALKIGRTATNNNYHLVVDPAGKIVYSLTEDLNFTGFLGWQGSGLGYESNEKSTGDNGTIQIGHDTGDFSLGNDDGSYYSGLFLTQTTTALALPGIRVYASVAAAQADSTFVVGGIYRLTGDSVLRIKTL